MASRGGSTNRAVRITVRDEGVGVDPDILARIFEPFEQTESSYAREQEGTGLGLTLTRKFVEMHGGEITLASEGRDKGATVTVLLPRDEAQAQPRASGENEVLEAVAPLAQRPRSGEHLQAW